MNSEIKTLNTLLNKARAKTEKAVAAYKETLPSYQLEKKLEDLIVTLNGNGEPAHPARPSAQAKKPQAPYTLTTKKQKAEILAIVDHEFELTDNRVHSVEELEGLLARKNIKIPGKSPRSTLTALLSRNKKKYERVGEKQYRSKMKNIA